MFSEYKPVIMCGDCLCWDIVKKKCLQFKDNDGTQTDREQCDFCSKGMCYEDQVRDLQSAIPEVTSIDIPINVWEQVKKGKSLLDSYIEWKSYMDSKRNV